MVPSTRPLSEGIILCCLRKIRTDAVPTPMTNTSKTNRDGNTDRTGPK